MPRAGLPGLPRQRLPRQPHPRPGVVEPNAERIQPQVLVPLFPRKGVVIMGIRPVALGREQLAVGIIAVVVGALALVFGEARNAPPPVQMNPVGLTLSARREVPQRQQHRRRAEGLGPAPVILRPLAVPQEVFRHRVQMVKCILRPLQPTRTGLGSGFLDQAAARANFRFSSLTRRS